MGYTDVRTALVEFFKPADTTQFDAFARVYRDWPWMFTADDWWNSIPDVEEDWGAVAAVHIDSSSETRLTLPAYTGSKQITYQVALLIWYQYLIPDDLGLDEADQWVSGLDLTIDRVKARIRSDQTGGTGGEPILQMGEGDNTGLGEPNIEITSDLPVVDDGIVYILTRVAWAAYEIINA
jgi:hypothetical protein